MTKDDSKGNTPWIILIVVAVIGAAGTIIAALIGQSGGNQATPAQTFTVDSMDSTLGWSTYNRNPASSLQIGSAPGMVNNAVELSFSLEKDGWVGIFRELSPGVLAGTDAIRFSYRGSGEPNSIELKLIYKPDDNGKSAVFSVLRSRTSNTPNWTFLEARYHEFVCWVDTGCQAGEKLDLDNIDRIDIAVSNKPGDAEGTGVVHLDEIQAVKY